MENDKIRNKMILKKSEFQYTEHISQYNRENDSIVVTGYHTKKRLYNFHNHNFFELIYVKQGQCINMVADDMLNMSEGDIIIMHPDAFHSLYADETCVPINVLISVSWMHSTAARLCSLPRHSKTTQFLSKISTPETYSYIYFHTNDEQKTSALRLIGTPRLESLDALIIESRMLELLCLLAKDSADAVLSVDRGINGGKFIMLYDYMVGNYRTITLDELASHFFYSKSHVCRLFKQYSGKSFGESLNEIKLRHAMSLLVNSTSTVERIAEQSGFNSIEYFHRLFKKRFGMTPLEYRALYKNYSE